jgi:hypothetical protein
MLPACTLIFNVFHAILRKLFSGVKLGNADENFKLK